MTIIYQKLRPGLSWFIDFLTIKKGKSIKAKFRSENKAKKLISGRKSMFNMIYDNFIIFLESKN